MKILINYKDNKNIIYTKNYQSVKSIINQFIVENKIDNEYDNFLLDYNGISLNNDYSLEKYSIDENSTLNIIEKKKGGAQNVPKYAIIIISVIIALIPIFILPLGVIPLTSSFIKIIIEKSMYTIGKYLVCTLGKSTIWNRVKLILFFFKYTVFFLMIFVLITFPLILLCISVKGHSILDDPKNMCGPISIGNTAGVILTIIFIFFYIIFRCGDYILEWLINLFKKVYILNTTINPLLGSLLSVYDKFKYLPIYAIPYVGVAFKGYFTFLDKFLDMLKVFLESVINVGCKTQFSKEMFLDKMKGSLTKMKDGKKEDHRKEDHRKEDHKKEDKKEDKSYYSNNQICENIISGCCSPQKFKMVGDVLMTFIENPITSYLVKSLKAVQIFVLFIESVYESGLYAKGVVDLYSLSYEQKRVYLRKILEEKIDEIPEDLKNSIKKFLESNNNNLILEIKTKLDKVYPNDDPIITEITSKLDYLEKYVYDYSKKDHSQYIPGPSLFKIVLKIIIVDVFCNVLSTAETTNDVFEEMGDAKEMADMLKAGTVSGVLTSICYIIAAIILIICCFFNLF